MLHNLTIATRAALMAAACVALTAAAIACSDDGSDVADGDATSSAAPTPPATAVATPSPESPPATPTVVAYDSNNTMYRIFAGYNEVYGYSPYVPAILNALADVREHDDTSLVWPIIESSRFHLNGDVMDSIEVTLRQLTGERFAGSDWKRWSEWAGRNRDRFPPPSEYFEWKLNYLQQIDERFSGFLRPVRDGKVSIDLTELEWGGVVPDGIPDLNHAEPIPAAEADYLDDDERVIGLEVNGEARAYPLRIINAHELANDTVGGEPIALTW